MIEVDPNDPAFQKPTKPIGSFMDQKLAMEHKEKDGWDVVEDSGRGWRRVVPSPRPQKIVQRDMIRESAVAGHIVIACGGIVVAMETQGELADFLDALEHGDAFLLAHGVAEQAAEQADVVAQGLVLIRAGCGHDLCSLGYQ